MNNIKQNKKDLNEEKLEIIEYGLEGLYLTLTKITILFIIAIILGIFKEMILILVFYNVIRFFAFGLHAKNSFECFITSLLLLIGGAYIAKYIHIILSVKINLAIICLVLIIIYAPADTIKHPLINSKKRKRFKILSIIISFIMTSMVIYFHNFDISNYMLVGYIEATCMILPITYKLFALPYNNYKNYSG